MSNRNGLGGVDPGGSSGLVYSTIPLLLRFIPPFLPLIYFPSLPQIQLLHLIPDTPFCSCPTYVHFPFLINPTTLPFPTSHTCPFLPYPALILTPQTHSPSYTRYTFSFLPQIHCQLLYPCRSISFSYLR